MWCYFVRTSVSFLYINVCVDVSLCMHVMYVWKGKAAGQRARCRPLCLCKYVRRSDEDTAQEASCSLIQCLLLAYTCVCSGFVCVYDFNVLRKYVDECLSGCVSLSKSCRDLNRPSSTHTHIPLFLCLGYFISARHGWCPGPTQRACSEVKSFTHKHCTSILKIGLFSCGSLFSIRGYLRGKNSFLPETCWVKVALVG